jgi:hypothetical protein
MKNRQIQYKMKIALEKINNEYGTLTYFVALNIVKIERIDFNYIISDK